METNKKITDAVSTTFNDFLDFALYDEIGKKIKDFDCVVMKRKLQTIVQEKTKDMSPVEIVAYFNNKSEDSVFA
jgi:hypothetical protein